MLRPGESGKSEKEGRCYFLKKRTKKLLSFWFRAGRRKDTSGGNGPVAKVFCFFFKE
jgi:hypothetical protein